MHKHTVQVRLDSRDEDEAALIKYLQGHSIFGRKSIAIRAMLLLGFKAYTTGDSALGHLLTAPRLINTDQIAKETGTPPVPETEKINPESEGRSKQLPAPIIARSSEKIIQDFDRSFDGEEPSKGLLDFTFGQDD